MIEIISGMPENVLAIRAAGEVTVADYEDILIPALEKKLKKSKRLRLLYQLGRDFTGFTVGAMWDDARVGLYHLNAFERIAVVTESELIVGAVRLFGLLMPCPVRVFRNDRLAEAKDWVAG